MFWRWILRCEEKDKKGKLDDAEDRRNICKWNLEKREREPVTMRRPGHKEGQHFSIHSNKKEGREHGQWICRCKDVGDLIRFRSNVWCEINRRNREGILLAWLVSPMMVTVRVPTSHCLGALIPVSKLAGIKCVHIALRFFSILAASYKD